MSETNDLYAAIYWSSVALVLTEEGYKDPRNDQRFAQHDPALTNPVDGRFGRPMREAGGIARQFAGPDVTIEPNSDASFYVRGLSLSQCELIREALEGIISENREHLWYVSTQAAKAKQPPKEPLAA
ncbi:MAG: hypothetical protein PHO20_03375 [Candidatus Peribacteraceae bacterium]|nr:hypothetical protein [Candidatus Peribacteraceae bacterium]